MVMLLTRKCAHVSVLLVEGDLVGNDAEEREGYAESLRSLGVERCGPAMQRCDLFLSKLLPGMLNNYSPRFEIRI
jgi:hypothetical protein